MATTTLKRDSMDATAPDLTNKLASTTLSPSPPRKHPLGLTDLPPSIRNTIYKYTLDTELVNVGAPNVSYTHALKDGVLQFRASRPVFPVTTALFYVCKSISAEALRYFYATNLFVRFEVFSPDARHAKAMLEDSGLLFSVAGPDVLEQSTRHALDVVLVEKGSAQKRAEVMFPAQYLPRLINFLDQARAATPSWATKHALFLAVKNTYGFPVSRVQGDLLEGFRLLADLGGATVDAANTLPGYASGLQDDLTAAGFVADEWMASVRALADRADGASEKEEYALANEYAQSVVIALTYGYLTHGEALHSQDEVFAKEMQRLRWRVELGVGIALSLAHRDTTDSKTWMDGRTKEAKVAARELLLAESSISKALSLATDSPSPASNPWFLSLPVELIPPNKNTWFTDAERAQTWYALGTVHTALGEYLFAAGDLERALGLWGEDGKEKVEKAFEKARGGIDGDRESMWEGKIKPGSGLKKASALARLEG